MHAQLLVSMIEIALVHFVGLYSLITRYLVTCATLLYRLPITYWEDVFFRGVHAQVYMVKPRGGTPIHYLYGYVPPKGVVILKLLI